MTWPTGSNPTARSAANSPVDSAEDHVPLPRTSAMRGAAAGGSPAPVQSPLMDTNSPLHALPKAQRIECVPGRRTDLGEVDAEEPGGIGGGGPPTSAPAPARPVGDMRLSGRRRVRSLRATSRTVAPLHLSPTPIADPDETTRLGIRRLRHAPHLMRRGT
ncbi:hypothetical protein OOK36_36995 [Streptomyces sp. NBC_00365]|uniref:hypothetical protein n=1 Tax=Streptomyces sp. NBC_00365 TaxID=2975726 RepID=UPI00225A865F|nr:hypothetical protein [Streptomyces sp. NBC_00365]MCX5094366.1 hypothetical protein [Streptomyces sp. NBC_00365]